MSLESFLAFKYLLGSTYEKSISTMVWITIIALAIASGSLALVVSVMRGFEHETHAKLQGIHAHIIMRSNGAALNTTAIQEIITKEFPAIVAVSPNSIKQVIIKNPESNDISQAVILKAVDPQREIQTTTINEKMIGNSLPAALAHNHIVIGKSLADANGVTVGQTITLVYPASTTMQRKKVSLETHEVIVGGIFKTGIEEFDAGMTFCSIELFDTLFPDTGVTQLNIKVNPDASLDTVAHQLHTRFGIQTYTWKTLYAPLVAALKLEKYAMFLILTLIALVACMSIASVLFMQIIQKRGDIAMLLTMGMKTNSIIKVFRYMGVYLAAIGGLIGLTLAAIIGWLLKRFIIIDLPDTYYVSHLPVKMELSLFIIIFLVIIMLAWIITHLAAQHIRRLSITNVLRYEA